MSENEQPAKNASATRQSPARSWGRLFVSLAIGVLLAVMLLFLSFYAIRYFFFGRWTLPTTGEFVAIAQIHQHIAQAINDYRADHGMLPQKLDDLVPTYLNDVPSNMNLGFSGHILSIHAGVPHTYVSYDFKPEEEGWYVGGDFGDGQLPVPKALSTRQPLTGESLANARLAEYDRRISTSNDLYFAKNNYSQKIAYLVSLGRKSEAIETCRVGALAFPDWWRPRMCAAMLTGSEKTINAEKDLRSWVSKYPTFIHYWYLCHFYRSLDRHEDAIAALQEAVKHSLADTDPDGDLVPDAYAFDAAAYACQRNLPGLVLEITKLWEKPRGVYTYHNENLNAFKAAAELALGKFDEAESDLQIVLKGRGLWVRNLDQLRRAVKSNDQGFVYDAGKLSSVDWTPFPKSE